LRNSELHLEDLIHEVIAGEECLLRPKQKDVHVRVYIDQRIPEYIVGDERRVNQISHHVLSNGIKFTEKGSVVLKIVAAKKAIRLEVRDTGIGIECPERLHNLEEFEQLEKTSNRRFDGLGLGLALCRKILKSVGGKLHIQSTLHQGTTVLVEIPAVYEYDETLPEVFKLMYESPTPYPRDQTAELSRNPIV
jgi:signal transduction histidine kinase